MKRPKKLAGKPVNYEIVTEYAGKHMTEPYLLLQRVRNEFHFDLGDARIALAWRKNEKADNDGHLVLGKCVKVTDLQKEFADWDFIIVLNKEIWQSFEWTEEKKIALLDHELCHASISYDSETGEKKVDERGRTVFRTRKHDIEEFQSVIQHHGCYKRDLERFAETILAKQRTPLLNQEVPAEARVN